MASTGRAAGCPRRRKRGVSTVCHAAACRGGVAARRVGLAMLLVKPRVGLLGFVALVTLLPFAVVPVRFGVQLTVLDVVLICLLVGWLARASQRGERIEITRTGVALLCLLRDRRRVVRDLVAVRLHAGAGAAVRQAGLEYALFVVTFNLVTDTQWLVRHLRALIVSGSVAAVLGLVLVGAIAGTSGRAAVAPAGSRVPQRPGGVAVPPGAERHLHEHLARGRDVDRSATSSPERCC